MFYLGQKKLHSGKLVKTFEVMIKKVLVHLLVKSCQSMLSQKSSWNGLLVRGQFGDSVFEQANHYSFINMKENHVNL